MDYRRLGKSNLKVSRLWLGGMSFGDPTTRAWVLDEEQSRRIIIRAVELGINTIDTCNTYCEGVSEAIIGRTVKELGARDSLVIATKMGFVTGLGPNEVGYSRKNIIRACEASLRRLGTDYIDLYQTHIWRPETQIEEMVAAFDRLVQDGKVLYVGAADMPAWQMAKSLYGARATGQAEFISMQYHYNAIWREAERELMPLCTNEGVGLVPYSPLARGYLCGSKRSTVRERGDDRIDRWYRRPADEKIVESIAELASQKGEPAAAIALSWVLSRPAVAATVVGPTNVEQLEQLVSKIDLTLSPEEIAQIDSQYAYRANAGH